MGSEEAVLGGRGGMGDRHLRKEAGRLGDSETCPQSRTSNHIYITSFLHLLLLILSFSL